MAEQGLQSTLFLGNHRIGRAEPQDFRDTYRNSGCWLMEKSAEVLLSSACPFPQAVEGHQHTWQTQWVSGTS